MRMTKKTVLKIISFVALLLLMAGSLTACGKRPGSVDLPDGTDGDYSEHIYPDIATDPKP